MVEDEPALAGLVRVACARAGFSVDAVERGEDALAALAAMTYDAVILDLRLPDCDGMAVLRELRARKNTTPVLVLTARDRVEERIAGLDAGADDYLVKPFQMGELLARVRALLRRPGAALGSVIELGNLALDTISRELRVEGRPVALSPRELALFEEMARRAGRTVPKRLLEDRIYGFGEEVASNSIEVLVHRLRRKLVAARANVALHTIRGIGYLLTDGSK